jgi:hypothetical protein
MVGRGREEHVRELSMRGTRANGGDQRPLGSFVVAHLDAAPEQPREPRRLELRRRQRCEREARRLPRRVLRDVGGAVVERHRHVFGIEPRRELHEARQRRQSAEPAAAPALDAELQSCAENLHPTLISVDERDRRLREHERDVPLETVVQPLALVRDVVEGRRGVDVDVVAVELDREAAQIVCPLVERPAGAQVEPGVVPVAGQDPVRDRAAVQRKAHVRAAVVDGEDLVALGEEADDVAADVDDDPTGGAQLAQRSGAHEAGGSDLSSHEPHPRT